MFKLFTFSSSISSVPIVDSGSSQYDYDSMQQCMEAGTNVSSQAGDGSLGIYYVCVPSKRALEK
jgi:hypothetical protein